MLSSAQKKAAVVADYQLGKTLGTGSSGKVKLATHLQTREMVDSLLIN